MPTKKGKKRAKADGEERGRGGGNGKKQKNNEVLEVARGMKKVAALRAELVVDRADLDAQRAALAAREKELDRYEAKLKAQAARQAKKEANRVAKAKAEEAARMSRRLSCFSRAPDLCMQRQCLADEAVLLKHTSGMITTKSQSRCILLLVIRLMQDGLSSSEATTKVRENTT